MEAAVSVRMWPEEDTRTPEKFCFYTAETQIDGVTYRGRSRTGASNELARVLVAAGVPDAPMHVEQVGIAGHLVWKSFHKAALWTYEETATKPLRRIPYAEVEAGRERLRARRGAVEGQNQGGTPSPGILGG